jgi:hypothetical protein
MNKLATKLLWGIGLAVMIGLSAPVGAAGLFPGFPALTFPATGAETFPADTNLSAGRQPQTELFTLNALHGYTRTPYNLTDASTISVDASPSSLLNITLTGTSHAFGTPINVMAGQVFRIAVIQDSTGSRTASWHGVYKWQGGSAPTLSTTAGRIDLMTIICDQVSSANVAVRCLASSSLNYTP